MWEAAGARGSLRMHEILRGMSPGHSHFLYVVPHYYC